MSLLNIDEIFAAADLIGGKQGNSHDPQRKQVCFPSIHDKKQDLNSCFWGRETRETGFIGGVGANGREYAGYRTNNPISPPPPEVGLNREKATESTIPVSFVSRERDTQYLCGVQADQAGKHPCFPLFPLFPEDAEVLPEFEDLIERAAIREYDGGLSRAEAEAQALKDFIEHQCCRGPLCNRRARGCKWPRAFARVQQSCIGNGTMTDTLTS